MKHHPWNLAFGALLPLAKKDKLYKEKDIIAIEKAATDLLQQFIKEGIPCYSGGRSNQVVKGVKITFDTISENNSYVDLKTIQIKMIL